MKKESVKKMTSKKLNVTIYTTQTCPYCQMAKEFLKEKKIKFKEINVGKDYKAAQEMVRKSGQMGVPVIDINGQIIVGFDKDSLKRHFKL